MDGHIPPEVHASLREVPNPINEGKVLSFKFERMLCGYVFFLDIGGLGYIIFLNLFIHQVRVWVHKK